MEGEVITPAQFARKLGVSGTAVYKAIRTGRLAAYDGDGKRVSPGFLGRKWLKPDPAAEDWHNRRQRFNDGDGSRDLLAARTRTANLQRELLEIKLAKMRGELISLAEVRDDLQVLGRAVQRLFKSSVEWSEELYAAGQAGGLGAHSALLRAKLIEFNNTLADMIEAEAARYGESGEPESPQIRPLCLEP
jgi:hypothetical protein